MPNHTNILDVTGSDKQLATFKKKVYRISSKAKGDEKDDAILFDFNGTVPMPASMHITSPARTDAEKKTYKDNIKKYGAGDWHSWACKYWGTKWGGYDASKPEEIPDGLRFRFNTAWSPPAQWIETTAKQFPDLKFQDCWIDEGGGAGKLEVWTENKSVRVEETSLSDHDWRIEFDEEYRNEYTLVTDGDYDELIQQYVIEKQDFNYSDNEVLFVKRIQDKDLLLLSGLDTLNDDAMALVEERLKGKPKKKPTKKRR
jgi:hypothetical protein